MRVGKKRQHDPYHPLVQDAIEQEVQAEYRQY